MAIDLNALLRVEAGVATKNWTLKNDDTKEVISGQYAPQDYTENAGAKIPEVSTVNNQEPFPQWVGGEGETSSFTARIFQTSSNISVKSNVEKLKKATKKDEKLFRAPIFTFTWGLEIAFKCFVVSIGGIKYDEISDQGTIKGAQFNMVLRRIENIPTKGIGKLRNLSELPRDVKQFFGDIEQNIKDTINIIGGSLHTTGRTVKVKQGDTFESIAQLEYGDALVGDILRRGQPDKVNMKAGDEVILVDEIEIFEIEVTPQANALKRTTEAAKVREKLFELRNVKQVKVL